MTIITTKNIKELFDSIASGGVPEWMQIRTDAMADILRTEREKENKAWLEGKRCSECGKEKPANPLWSTCEECV